jgi:hypothetical protein
MKKEIGRDIDGLHNTRKEKRKKKIGLKLKQS